MQESIERLTVLAAELASLDNLHTLALAFRERNAALKKLEAEVEAARKVLVANLPVGKTFWDDLSATVSEVEAVRLDPGLVREFHPRVFARCSRKQTSLRLTVR